MAGAIRLTGEAALRVGAGLVSVVSRPKHVTLINSGRPELMCYGTGLFRKKILKLLCNRVSVVAIGPGLGLTAWSKLLLHQILAFKQPKVVDADALNLLAKNPNLQPRSDWILTPHPGEAARLLNTTATKIQTDRVRLACELQKKFGGVIVLKGAFTLIVDHHHQAFICHAGNPGMASSGMGDVLTGVIAGLIAQGLTLVDAAKWGVYLHARSGDLAALQKGERGLVASDLFTYLQSLVNVNHSTSQE
jgi:ADP-dependent NAD(P)H-hydrate dehydratase / NAD(P)H-hydrate epimerase